MSVQLDDVPWDLQERVNIIGMENFLKVCKFYGGRSLYVPLYKNLLIKERNRNIVKEYNGKNLDELRLKYNMSNTQLKRVMKSK